ncbi:MAG: MBL fold metallo-hydrolase [Chloroflexi bacterium]|nr:MBL fold metallo-hydrolase [Chloroflexota bacterium]
MAKVTEIANDLYRISMFVPQINLQFNYFLVKDEEPLLFTTGFRATFPELRDAVASVLEPSRIKWIGFSHFESDECGALNQWLDAAPHAQPVCSFVGALVSVNDFADRPPRGMADGETLATGKYRYRFCSTAQLPHGWDAGVLFEETTKTLLCSDLFHHDGDVEPITESDLSERVRDAILRMQASPLAGYIPYTPQTRKILHSLADLKPKTLAVMHGSSYTGDGEHALRSLSTILQETLDCSPDD